MKISFLCLLGLAAWAAVPGSAGAAPYAIATERINLRGHQLVCDSFDSTDPARSTNGHYDPAKRAGGAQVGASLGIVSSSSVGTVDIWGSLETGPSFSLETGAGSSIGSSSWHLAGMTGIEPGFH